MSKFIDAMAASFEDELQKIASASESAKAAVGAAKKSGVGKYIVPAAAGAAAYETLRRANKDRKMGRMMRRQGGGQMY